MEFDELEDHVADIDLLRELVLQKLTFSFKGEARSEEDAPKRRGRPPGSKNKKEAEPASADPFAAKRAFGGTRMPVEGNDVDPDASAEAMKAKFEGVGLPEDGSIPPWLDRTGEAGASA